MKKKIVSLLLVSVMAMSMVACGNSGEGSATESTITMAPSEFVAAVDANIPEEETLMYMEFDAAMIEGTYGITADMYTDISARQPMIMQQSDELVVIQAADGQVDAIKAALEARVALLTDPANGGYPEHIDFANDYKLLDNGNFIVFAIGMHADKAVEAFEAQ